MSGVHPAELDALWTVVTEARAALNIAASEAAAATVRHAKAVERHGEALRRLELAIGNVPGIDES